MVSVQQNKYIVLFLIQALPKKGEMFMICLLKA